MARVGQCSGGSSGESHKRTTAVSTAPARKGYCPPSTRLANAMGNSAKTSAEKRFSFSNGWIKAEEEEETLF